MPKQPAGKPAKKSDLDLTPPEEIRARRIKRFVLVSALAACALGVAIYFTASPIAGAIKGWQSRRLARQAFALIEQRKWSEANARARDAFLLRPTEPESWRAIARLACRTNQWPAALDWWKKVDDANGLTVEDRRDYISAALVTGDVSLADKQVQELLAQRAGPAPIDLVFAGQVASRHSDPATAVGYAQRVLADKRARPNDILAAATLILSVTSPYSQPYATAWHEIENVARDPKNPSSLDALTVLARQEAVPPLPPLSDPSLSLASTSPPYAAPTATRQSVAAPESVASVMPTHAGSGSPLPESPPQDKRATSTSAHENVSPAPEMPQNSTSSPALRTERGDALTLALAATPPPANTAPTMTANEVADALEKHPDARPYQKLLALELRARHDPGLAEQYVRDAIERFGNAARLAETYQAELADETLLALVAWLNKIGRPAKTLEVLPQARAIQRADFFLQYLNALVALQRWNEIKDLLMGEHSVVDPMIQHMYLAVAQGHMGSATGATNEWQRALQVANTPDKLLTLASNAEQNSAQDIADSAYSEAIRITPTNRAAYVGRLRLALAGGDTAKAQTIAADIARTWPDDSEARNQNTYLQLLLGASDRTAETAEREAQVLVAKEPRNWQARATLGLACLRLGRKQEALAAIREPRVTGVEPPGALAVRAAILAANGYTEPARNDARLVSANPLLPEERALIAPLLQ